jgi:hypothetical protein
MGFVDGPQVSRKVVEAREGIKEVCFDQVPILFEEGRPKAIRPGAGVVIHGKNGGTDLIK